MRPATVTTLAAALSWVPVMSSAAEDVDKRIGVLIVDPAAPNGTNVNPAFKTRPLMDSEVIELKFAKDFWIMEGDRPFQNWRGVVMFIHVLDGSEVNVLQVSTPTDLFKLPPGMAPPGSPVTTPTPGTPIKWPLPVETVPLTVSFFPTKTKGGADIPSSGVKWSSLNVHTFPMATLRLHAKNTDSANNSDFDISAQVYNIIHGKGGQLKPIVGSDYVWVPKGFQFPPVDPQHDCCFPHQTPGCNDPGCVNLVCQVNPNCCPPLPWDGSCVKEARQLCPQCLNFFPNPQAFGRPGDPEGTGHWTHWELPPWTTVPASIYFAQEEGPAGVGKIFVGIEHPQDEPCPWDCADPPNKIVDVVDFLALLGGWGLPGPCDFDGNGAVDVVDFLKLLGQWGPCPAPVNDECPGAIAIARADAEGSANAHFDMYGATPSPDPYKCLLDPPVHKDLWYTLTNASGTKKLVTVGSDVDLFVEVNAGCTCPPGPVIACGRGLGGLPQFEMQPGACVTIRLINDLGLPNDVLKGNLTIQNKLPPTDVNFYTDPAEFITAVALAGKVEKFFWAFKPDLLPPAGIAALDDPLDITTHALDPDDPWGTLWPLEVDNVTFVSNMAPQGPLTPEGLNGLVYIKAGFLPELTNNALVANFFADSFDIVSGPPAGDNHTAIGMELISLDLDGPGPVLFHVTVYDKLDMELGKATITAIQGDKVFLGVITKDTTIGRVDIWDELGGAEGISSITAFAAAPNPFGCPGKLPCCDFHPASPGCDDIDCCRAVCASNPACCTVGWDIVCLLGALSLPECACGPNSD